VAVSLSYAEDNILADSLRAPPKPQTDWYVVLSLTTMFALAAGPGVVKFMGEETERRV